MTTRDRSRPTPSPGGLPRVARTALRLVFVAAAVAVLVQLARWAGTPAQNAALFPLGVVASVASLLLLAAGARWLLAGPAPTGSAAADARGAAATRRRRRLANLLLAGFGAVVFAAFWDAAWHTVFGLPFGADLLWRPHLLMYAGFATIPAAGLLALLALRGRSGTWRERFRADPPLTATVLLGAYFLYAVPADPAWHLIYGEDITAWSLPHLMLVIHVVLMGVIAEWLRRSTRRAPAPGALGRSGERGDRGDARATVATILAAALGLALTLVVMAIEYDALVGGADRALAQLGPLFERPQWVFVAVVAAIGAGFGATTLAATRRVGAATAVGLLALALRALGSWGVPGGSAVELTDVKSTLLLLPLLATLDLVAWRTLRTRPERIARPPRVALAAAIGALLTLPLLALLYRYPVVDGATLPGFGVAAVVAAALFGWGGARLGSALVAGGAAPAPGPGPVPPVRRAATAFGYGVATLALVWFVVTAVPPA